MDANDIANDPRFMRAAPETYRALEEERTDRVAERFDEPKTLVAPPKGLRTGYEDQMKESVRDSLMALHAEHQESPREAASRRRETLREAAHDSLRYSRGRPVELHEGRAVHSISEFTYRSGKHVRRGDAIQDHKGSIYAVRAFNEESVLLEHARLGEIRVGQRFLEHCLLLRRMKR